MKKRLRKSVHYSLVISLIWITSCNILKPQIEESEPSSEVEVKEEEKKSSAKPQLEYQSSPTRVNDLIHTELEIRFDWEQQHVIGKARLTVKPYFYPTKTLELDARGFSLRKVELFQGDSLTPLTFTYDSIALQIELDREYTRKDTYNIQIEYIAKPNEIEDRGSEAIASGKGLYFINPTEEDTTKPQQIWTQGEVQSNSCWFPTIDRPNERMTQEIYLTVDKRFVTLSNGMLIYSLENEDGTRTDYWKQSLPHAPYLTMLAVGEFVVVKDTWRDLLVHYFVDSSYAHVARDIFGNTPEMLEFFSNRLGVDYPWEKYHQVVVKDFVSGAMENTTAVVHGNFLHQTKREMLDGNHEDVIAHEMAHHWFGDYVTCESWANVPLNESFATYGEYLWMEYKYGQDHADAHLQKDLEDYLRESRTKQVDLIRYYHKNPDDLFDRHSYSKGARVLHMLRKYVGDEAFFASLKLYLEQNKLDAAEIHDLRLAFEEVTGEDLNWFFNQWFLSAGHPEISLTYEYDGITGKQLVIVEQTQSPLRTGIYRLPIAIDLYWGNKKKRFNVVIENQKDTFYFDSPTPPLFINTDAEKMLLCTKKDEKTNEQWAYQYSNAPLYLDRYEAIEKMGELCCDSISTSVLLQGLNDKYWEIRLSSVKQIKADFTDRKRVKPKLLKLANSDEKSLVRAEALLKLAELFPEDDSKEMKKLFASSLEDSSYAVVCAALPAISKIDPEQSKLVIKDLEQEGDLRVLATIAKVYAEFGTEEDHAFFLQNAKKFNNWSGIQFLDAYSRYLRNGRTDKTVEEGIDAIREMVEKTDNYVMSYFYIQALKDIDGEYAEREFDLNDRITSLEQTEGSQAEKDRLQLDLDKVKSFRNRISKIIDETKGEASGERDED